LLIAAATATYWSWSIVLEHRADTLVFLAPAPALGILHQQSAISTKPSVSVLDSHPILRLLAADLRANPGRPESDEGDPARAAVAIILRVSQQRAESDPTIHDARFTVHQTSKLEILLIQRAVREGDPWSGQIALPGGRRDPEDATLQDTAIRETLEETGLDLATEGVVLGVLDELRPRTPVLPPIIVTPFVAAVAGGTPLQISDELSDAFWVPWSTFEDPTRLDESTVQVRGASWQVTSYLVGERVVWGMTERMLRQLATRIRALGAV
jgi:8-oxo-dGTP pyrophosphatase MutT (NUDIX family)